jgi:prevent-host-death family protein
MALRTMSSEQARTEWRTLLDLASKGDVDIVIERHGKKTAAVISYEMYQALRPIMTEIRTDASVKQRGYQMADVLTRLAELPERTAIADPVMWQIQQREDRAQYGRDSEC